MFHFLPNTRLRVNKLLEVLSAPQLCMVELGIPQIFNYLCFGSNEEIVQLFRQKLAIEMASK